VFLLELPLPQSNLRPCSEPLSKEIETLSSAATAVILDLAPPPALGCWTDSHAVSSEVRDQILVSTGHSNVERTQRMTRGLLSGQISFLRSRSMRGPLVWTRSGRRITSRQQKPAAVPWHPSGPYPKPSPSRGTSAPRPAPDCHS
jgi:hypothetical protein